MRRIIPTSPQARAVMGLVAVMAVAVAVLGSLSTGAGDRAEVVPTGEEAAGTTSTTRARTTTPATVLGAVIDRDEPDDAAGDDTGDAAGDASPPVATTTAAPPATTLAPATAAPPPTTAAPPTAAPTTTEQPTTTEAQPAAIDVAVRVTSADAVRLSLDGPEDRSVVLPAEGGDVTFGDLAPGTYALTVSWSAAPPDDQDPEGPQVGPIGRAERSDDVQLGAGDRLSATFDGESWTLVLG